MRRRCRVLFPAVSAERLESRRLLSTTYYVSSAGSDTNPGTSTSVPWKTVAPVNATNFKPGDKVLFQGGSTFTGTVTFDPNDGGSASNPVTIGSYGTGRATLSVGAGEGIVIYDTGGINVSNINVVGAGIGANTGAGVHLFNDIPNNQKAHVYIDQVDCSGFGFVGIAIGSAAVGSGFSDVRITNTVVHDNDFAGVFSYAGDFMANPAPYGISHDNIYVGHVTAYNNTGHAGTNDTGDGIELGNVNGATIERCVAHDNGSANVSTGGGPIGIWAYNSNNVVIQYNESYHNLAASRDGGGFDLDGGCTNCIMQYNYSHDNYGSGYLFAEFPGANPFTNNTLRYNISQNDGRRNNYGAIELGTTSSSTPYTNCEIYGNTVYVSTANPGFTTEAVFIKGSTKNVHFRNNIFYTTGGVTPTIVVNTAGTGLLFQGNDYWTTSATAAGIVWLGKTYNTLADFRSGTGQEKVGSATVGISAGPLLVDPGGGTTLNNADQLTTVTAYQIKSGSPAINAGVNLNALGVSPGSHDFYGNSVPQGSAFDIGASEFVPDPLPLVLTNVDIGSPSPTGKATTVTAGSAYDVSGGGTRIANNDDHFHFLYTTLTGDFDASVRIASFTATDPWAKAGLMVRSSLTSTSPDIFASVLKSAGSDVLVSRTTTAAYAAQTDGGAPSYPNAWLRLRRVGNTFTAYYGTDGTHWTQLGSSVTVALANTLYFGLAVCSRVDGQLATAQFRNLSVV